MCSLSTNRTSFVRAGAWAPHALASRGPAVRWQCFGWANTLFEAAVESMCTGMCQFQVCHQLSQTHISLNLHISTGLLSSLSDSDLVSYQWERDSEAYLLGTQVILGHCRRGTFGHGVVLYCHLLRGCLIPCLTSHWRTAGAPQASGQCLHETCQMSTSCLAGSSWPRISDKQRRTNRTIHNVLSTKQKKTAGSTTLKTSADNVQNTSISSILILEKGWSNKKVYIVLTHGGMLGLI